MEHMKYMGKEKFEKALHTLIGILQGIRADQVITDSEVEELKNWCLLQHEHESKFPFKEIIPMIKFSLDDGILTEDEIEDMLWSCNNYLNKNPYFDTVAADIQELHGIMHGILSDGKITADELVSLKEWLDDRSHLETVYPYDEVYALLYEVMRDGMVDDYEERILKSFFGDFIDASSSLNINKGEIDSIRKEMNIQGICALAPNIEITDKLFCFTGESSRLKRSEIGELIASKGGKFRDSVVKETNYLIVGDGGNPCWAFSCYGRKIEKAVLLRKQGKPIVIAHEVDFWDSLN